MKMVQRRPSPAMAVAFIALLVALGGTALGDARPGARETAVAGALGNVKVVKTAFSITNQQVKTGEARCPAGTRIFSGGFAADGQQARILYAGPSRTENAYIGGAFMPAANINAGVLSETATITLVGYCGPVGKPVVLR